MKTSIFNMTLTLPPLIEMTEVEKDMPTATYPPFGNTSGCQETNMKTSIFNMTLTLPPMLEMAEVEKDMPIFNMTQPHVSRTFCCRVTLPLGD